MSLDMWHGFLGKLKILVFDSNGRYCIQKELNSMQWNWESSIVTWVCVVGVQMKLVICYKPKSSSFFVLKNSFFVLGVCNIGGCRTLGATWCRCLPLLHRLVSHLSRYLLKMLGIWSARILYTIPLVPTFISRLFVLIALDFLS